MLSSSSVQLSYNGVKVGRSIILLNIKCPQLSNPKDKGDSGKEPKLHQVTELRKKKLGKNQLIMRKICKLQKGKSNPTPVV